MAGAAPPAEHIARPAARDGNRRLYERRATIRQLVAQDHLEPPERVLLERVRRRLPAMHVLDLGVGAGRTTIHFGALAKQYVGVDYSAPLIAACRKRFADLGLRFEHADVRAMPMLDDCHFDLVLFTVNGLDCLPHEGRTLALQEISRVCRPGGLLFFSAHNLEAVEKALSPAYLVRQLRATRSGVRFPLAAVRRLPMRVLARVSNPAPTRLLERDWAWVSTGWPPRSPQGTYHVRLAEVRRQLAAVAFALDAVLLPSGEEVSYEGAHGRRDDLWLNFLARKQPEPRA